MLNGYRSIYMSQINRLFIGEYSKMSKWGPSGILSNVRPGDLYLMPKDPSEKKLSKNQLSVLEKMSDHVEIFDVDSSDAFCYQAVLWEKIQQYADVGTTVYFLSMQEMFDTLKNEISKICDGVGSAATYRVGKTALFNSDSRGEQMTMGIPENGAMKSIAPEKKNNKSRTNKKSGSSERKGNQPAGANHGAGNNSDLFDTMSQITSGDGVSSGKSNTPPPEEEGVNIKELEKSIFETSVHDVKIDNSHSALDDCKANLVDALLQRFEKHVLDNAGGVKEYNLDLNQYTQMILLLIKTENRDDFLTSWSVTEPLCPMKLADDMYAQLKNEAEYYEKVCNLIYGGDAWDY